MNIKLHTPKTLKSGSGMGSIKQFLLSLLATTVSIALTFGTAAIVDHNKKQREKHEIVMMVMYDMYNSLKTIEKADSSIQQSMKIQRQLVEDTTQFDKQMTRLLVLVSGILIDYTETTERIFSSSIESINTVGNVLFTENVAEFYRCRQMYKAQVCDSVLNKMAGAPFTSLKGTLDFDYMGYALTSIGLTKSMKQQYAQCKQMMEVSDEEIDAYRQQREQIDRGSSEDESTDSMINEIIQHQRYIERQKSKLKLE
ncbi:MAG: hypothetical protein II404_01270 [Prevotella sp.]|nr:hypothetical protein [Prevotella sp.]